MKDGRAVMPQGPGWGVRIQAAWLAARIAWSRRPADRFWSLSAGGAHFGGCAFSHACCFLSTSAS